jgi:hypothetical protein
LLTQVSVLEAVVDVCVSFVAFQSVALGASLFLAIEALLGDV